MHLKEHSRGLAEAEQFGEAHKSTFVRVECGL
jgi:hypothetical protein